MPIVVTCTSCQTKMKAPYDAAGKRIECPGCAARRSQPRREEAPPDRDDQRLPGEDERRRGDEVVRNRPVKKGVQMGLGIAALSLGIFAVGLALLDFHGIFLGLGWLVLAPLAALGLLLALIACLVAALHKFCGLLFPLLGLFACGLAIALAVSSFLGLRTRIHERENAMSSNETWRTKGKSGRFQETGQLSARTFAETGSVTFRTSYQEPPSVTIQQFNTNFALTDVTTTGFRWRHLDTTPSNNSWTASGVGPIEAMMTKLQNLDEEIGRGLKAEPPPWNALGPKAKEYARIAVSMGQYDPPSGSKESWERLTSSFASSAASLDRAVQVKDREIALRASKALTNSCSDCHLAHAR